MTIAINIRGTGGSGKSTLVKRIMELYPYKGPVVIPSVRRQPLGYLCGDDPYTDAVARGEVEATPPKLWVPGHYETACGGCDTIKTVDEVYRMLADGLEKGRNVLYEGIMVMDDVRRAVELDQRIKRGQPGGLYVIALTTPIEECLAAIQGRRDARGEVKPLNPKNTTDRARRLLGSLRRLEAAGVAVERLDREAAFLRVRELLEV